MSGSSLDCQSLAQKGTQLLPSTGYAVVLKCETFLSVSKEMNAKLSEMTFFAGNGDSLDGRTRFVFPLHPSSRRRRLPKVRKSKLQNDGDILILPWCFEFNDISFCSLKIQQGLLVDFTEFPQSVIGLLQSVLAEEHKEMPKSVRICVCVCVCVLLRV